MHDINKKSLILKLHIYIWTVCPKNFCQSMKDHWTVAFGNNAVLEDSEVFLHLCF